MIDDSTGGGRPGRHPAAGWSAAELALAWAGRDPEAFAEVYRRYAPAMLGTAVMMVGDRATAEDAVHDALLRASVRIHQLRDPERLRAWLFTVLRNEVTSRHRAGRREVVGPAADDVIGREPAGLPEPHEAISRRELAVLVRDAAASLQERDRELLELHLYAGLEARDVGEAIGVAGQHAAVLLTRMRDRMEKAIGALLLARHGWRSCAELGRLLDGWDGRYTVDVRSRVTRHAAGCASCRGRWTSVMSFERLSPAVWAIPPGEALWTRIAADAQTSTSAGSGHAGGEDPPTASPSGARPSTRDRPGRRGGDPARPARSGARVAMAAAVAAGGVIVAGTMLALAARGPSRSGPLTAALSPVVSPVVSPVGPPVGSPVATASAASTGPGKQPVAGPARGTGGGSAPPVASITGIPAPVGGGRPQHPGGRTAPAPGTSTPDPIDVTPEPGPPSPRPPAPDGPSPGRVSPPPDVVTDPPSPAVAPTIVRLWASPASVRRGGPGCQDRTTVTATVTASSAVTGTASWNGVPTRMGAAGRTLSATVGPFRTSASSATVTVTVTDTGGRRATGHVTVALSRCPRGARHDPGESVGSGRRSPHSALSTRSWPITES